MKLRTLLTLAALVVPALVFGSEDLSAMAEQYHSVAGRYTDYGPRIFNFLIFAGLAYYLVASPLKAFFVGRREGIARQLNEIEKKLQEAKDARKSAEQAVEESRQKAEEIAKDSKKEVELLETKFDEMTQKELSLLEKQFAEKEELEERRMLRETIDSVLSDNIKADDIPVSADKVIDIVSRKVA
jgi:F-type H+-transporting ATPase subunit b